MCCLFGILDYKNSLSDRQKHQILSVLSIACEVRGTDASGIAYRSGNQLCIYKRPLPAHLLHFRVPAETGYIMGHTRMTTQGRNRKTVTTTPFPEGQAAFLLRWLIMVCSATTKNCGEAKNCLSRTLRQTAMLPYS